jgi:hypothetical protein
MGLNLRFFARPYPLGWGADVADDRLPALGDMDVLNGHLLLAAASGGQVNDCRIMVQVGLSDRSQTLVNYSSHPGEAGAGCIARANAVIQGILGGVNLHFNGVK